MAQKILVQVQCDLDEPTDPRDAETVAFFHSSGQRYELDVCDEHAQALQDALEVIDDFAARGRRATATTPAPTSGKRRNTGQRISTGAHNPKEVRAWAIAQGIEVPARGRLPETVLEKYRTEH